MDSELHVDDQLITFLYNDKFPHRYQTIFWRAFVHIALICLVWSGAKKAKKLGPSGIWCYFHYTVTRCVNAGLYVGSQRPLYVKRSDDTLVKPRCHSSSFQVCQSSIQCLYLRPKDRFSSKSNFNLAKIKSKLNKTSVARSSCSKKVMSRLWIHFTICSTVLYFH